MPQELSREWRAELGDNYGERFMKHIFTRLATLLLRDTMQN